jgi:transposase InsO family protein
MARKVVAMEAKLLAVLTSGAAINVTEVCGRLGISRQTFYKYRRRFEAEGAAGLVERSRAPRRSPSAVPMVVEEVIVRLRKELEVDNGAQAIAWHLGRRGDLAVVPSARTVHRVLVRRGMVVPQPHKRPKTAVRRFEWPRPNDAWQIDATAWALGDGRRVWIMDVLDDHSRVLVAAQACEGPTAVAAWEAFAHGVARWGPPARVMSDNGSCFTGRFHHGEADFERQLRAMGIDHLLSSPGHPQTCGKLERSHRTTKDWLTTQHPPRTRDELQVLLDTWLDHYNHHRPHTAARGDTPAERWQATERARPGGPIAGPRRVTLHTVANNGTFGWGDWVIGVGSPFTGQTVLVVANDLDLAVWGQSGLLRRLTINPDRRYQPTGKAPGRPPHTLSDNQTDLSAMS